MTAHESYFDEAEGRWKHSLRQSWIKEAAICPERARMTWEHPELRRETDAAAVGTALHAAAELGLEADLDYEGCMEVWHQTFDEITHMPNFHWVKYNRKTAEAFGRLCVGRWYHEVKDTLDPFAELEVKFDSVPLIDDEYRLVEVEGCVDYWSPTDGLKDYKTSGRGEYVPWEHKRWDVQATVYTYAAKWLGLAESDVVPFELIVFHPKGVQRLTLERSLGDWNWLAQQAESLAILIEAELPVWPKQDNHALCSAKWCEAWALCKGRDLG